jgi:hypothetical protein
LSRARLWGALLALAVGGSASAADFKWEIPDVVADVDVPGTMIATGVPVKLRAVISKRHYDDVAAEVVKSFQKQGLYIAPDSHQPQIVKEPQLTGLDPVKMITYTVVLQPNKDGTTTVILGEANIGKIQRGPPADFAPMFPGARNVIHTDVEAMKTVMYDVPASRAEVEAFYKESLQKAGYVRDPLGSFRRGREELMIQVATQDGKTTVWLGQRVSAERSPPPP